MTNRILRISDAPGGGGDGVSGTWGDGNVLTLTRAAGGFGANGPTAIPEFFNGAAAGVDLSTGNSNFEPNGAYPPPKFNDTYYQSKGSSILFHHDYSANKGGNWIRNYWGSQVTEFIVAYTYRIHPTMLHPGAETGNTIDSAATDAQKRGSAWKKNWKFCWPQYSGVSGTPDIICPVLINAPGQFAFGGNGTSITDPAWREGALPETIFDIYGWNTWIVKFKADPTNPATADGYAVHELWSATQTPHRRVDSQFPIFAPASSTPSSMGSIYYNAWVDYAAEAGATGASSGIGIMLDLSYVAFGDYANALVLATNNAVYANSTEVAIQPVRNNDPSSYWADDEIQVDCNAQTNITGTAHLHVVPAGYPEGTPVYVGSIAA